MEPSKKERRELQNLGRNVRANIAEALYIGGHLTEKDFENEEVVSRKVIKYLDDLNTKGEEISITIDYQSSILEEAGKRIESENYELAYVFFGTYFEHLINGVIQVRCLKEKISSSTYKELIRKVSLEDKFTWVLEILKLPKFKGDHWKTIKDASERRNNFIHYKYQPQSNNPDYDEGEWEKMEKRLMSAIKYCKSYQTRVTYDGKAGKLRLKKSPL